MVYIRIGHETEAASGAVGVIGIRARPLLGLLEEGLHVLPAPASVAEALPLVKVLAVTAEVYHPIQHAEIQSMTHMYTLLLQSPTLHIAFCRLLFVDYIFSQK